jgi:hypothetical protein
MLDEHNDADLMMSQCLVAHACGSIIRTRLNHHNDVGVMMPNALWPCM